MVLSEEELRRWGLAIGAHVDPPVFLGLRGDLGAGKSVLARAVARGAGVEGNIPSPTFNLLFRYQGSQGRAVVHMDLYRLSDADEIWELGWEEFPGPEEIVLVEWPGRAQEHLPVDRWEVHLEGVPGDPRSRRVEITRFGDPPDLPTFPLSLDPGGGSHP